MLKKIKIRGKLLAMACFTAKNGIFHAMQGENRSVKAARKFAERQIEYCFGVCSQIASGRNGISAF